MRQAAFLMLIGVLLGFGTATLAKKPFKNAAVEVATLASSNGALALTDSMFAEHPDDAVQFVNPAGTVGYGQPCYEVRMTDGSYLDPTAVPPSLYMQVCGLVHVYNPNPSNNVTITATFPFHAIITYEPDYALSYKSLPRYVVTLVQD